MDNTKEIDLLDILRIFRAKLLYICIAAVVGAILAFTITKVFIAPVYKATVSMYVYNDPNRSSGMITSSEISAANSLVNTYIVIVKSDTVLDKVIDKLDLSMSAGQLRRMLTASAVNNTAVFEITVSHTDPESAQLIANTIADICPEEIIRVVKAGSVEVISPAKLPRSPSSPNLTKNVAIGFIICAVLCFLIFLLVDIFDTTIRSAEDLEHYGVPVLGSIPKLPEITSTLSAVSSAASVKPAKEETK